MEWGCVWLEWSLDATLDASIHVIEHLYRARIEHLEMTNEMWARNRSKNGPAMPRKPRSEDDGLAAFVQMLEAQAAGGEGA